jgi:hypothetical protein
VLYIITIDNIDNIDSIDNIYNIINIYNIYNIINTCPCYIFFIALYISENTSEHQSSIGFSWLMGYICNYYKILCEIVDVFCLLYKDLSFKYVIIELIANMPSHNIT